MNSYLPFVGRVLIGLPFAMSGLSKLAAYGPTTEKIPAVQMIHFLKNVMMAGGLLQIAAFGAGAISIEQWRRKSAAPSAAAAINA